MNGITREEVRGLAIGVVLVALAATLPLFDKGFYLSISVNIMLYAALCTATPIFKARPEGVGLEFEILGVAARAETGAELLRGAHHAFVAAPQPGGELSEHRRADRGVAALAVEMARDVMRRLVAEHEGQLVGVLHFTQKRHGKGQKRTALRVAGLKGVGGLAGAVIDHDVEIAIHLRGPHATFAFSDRFDRLQHADKAAGGFIGGKTSGLPLLRLGRDRPRHGRRFAGSHKCRSGQSKTVSQHHVTHPQKGNE